MASITVRQLTSPANTADPWDPIRGNGFQNFLSDLDAVAQILRQRMLLLQGEWFENLNIGTPLFQRILGVPNTSSGVALLLRQRILGTPFVTGIQNFTVTYSGASRIYTFSALVQTAFGTIALTTQALPGDQAAIG